MRLIILACGAAFVLFGCGRTSQDVSQIKDENSAGKPVINDESSPSCDSDASVSTKNNLNQCALMVSDQLKTLNQLLVGFDNSNQAAKIRMLIKKITDDWASAAKIDFEKARSGETNNAARMAAYSANSFVGSSFDLYMTYRNTLTDDEAIRIADAFKDVLIQISRELRLIETALSPNGEVWE
jgi:hypothetical protein